MSPPESTGIESTGIESTSIESTGLELVGLAIGYADPLVAEIDLVVAPGEVVAVLGPSGSGKSTLLSTIVGILPPLAGQVRLDGRQITDLPIDQRRVGIVFQEPLLFGHLDVLGNVAYGPRRRGIGRAESVRRALDLLEWVGLRDHARTPVGRLSGGQAQRVALARALAAEPAALLMDEPFSALDADLRTRLATEVVGWLRDRRISTLHVTHDLAEAQAIADRVLAVEPGSPGRLRSQFSEGTAQPTDDRSG